jgi:NB-ARC domain
MDPEEILKFADNLVFTKTGKHLDNVQEAILVGAWQGQKYPKIAEEAHCTEGHARDVASELWKILSDLLGETVNKSNFKSTLKRQQFSIVSSHYWKDIVQIGNVNVCPETLQSINFTKTDFSSNSTSQNTQPQIRQDLSDAPQPNLFYNRTSELSTLKQWILENRTHIITILGLTGIGKTTLTIQLIEQIKNEFDYIIYRSLHNAPTLQTLETNLIQFLRRGSALEERAIAEELTLLEYLRSHRCLLILDDLQTIFSSGKLAGNYQPGYENYGQFFKQLATSSHNSSLILLTWEKPKEIAVLESQNQTCKTLQLNGLGIEAEEIFREKGLAEPEKWPELINLYQGNPSWLNIVTAMIQDLFGGSISNFLSYNTLLLGDLESLLQQHFYRLSDSEKQVIFCLASQAEPMEISQIATHLELSLPVLLQTVESLGRRLLIEKVKQSEKTLFTLQPVLIEYVKNQP